MSKSFWKNKPVTLEKGQPVQTVYDTEKLLKLVEHELSNSKIHLDYRRFELDDLELVVRFINDNYMSVDAEHTLKYDISLIRYFLSSEQSTVLVFYPRNMNMIVGVVCGSKHTLKLSHHGQNFSCDCMDINFLCVDKQLRNMHVSSFLINAITMECVTRFNTIYATYTTANLLKVPYFSKKYYFHRPLNIDQVVGTGLFAVEFDSELIRKVYNTFNFQYSFKRQTTMEYYHQSELLPLDQLQDLTDKLNQYHQLTHKIYFHKQIAELEGIFINPNFHVFVFRKQELVTDMISFFKVDTVSLQNDKLCRNGYLYHYFLSCDELSHKQNIFESVAKHCYENNIFDMLTICDPFGHSNKEYKGIKFLKGTGHLQYYLYNLHLPDTIDNDKNGLITI
jgi:hypothetical protein